MENKIIALKFGEWLLNSDWEYYDNTSKGDIYKSKKFSNRKNIEEIYEIFLLETKIRYVGQKVKYFDEICTIVFIHDSGLINLQKQDGYYHHGVHPTAYVTPYDPHEASKVKCDLCGFEWIAVRPEGLTKLECKQCGNMVHFENIT